MKPLLIFRHVAHEGPGYLGEFLARRHRPYETIAIDAGAKVPTELPDVAGLVFMGGPMSVNDAMPWIDAELNLIRAAARIDLPMLGHCLGAQLISKAMGGQITANPVKEIGWLSVDKQPDRHAPDWLASLPERFEVFHWHGETYSLPEGATRILSSAHCREQGFVRGRTLALQCHIEMTADMVRDWAVTGSSELASPSATVQSPQTMTEHLETRIQHLQGIADRIYSGWLQVLDT